MIPKFGLEGTLYIKSDSGFVFDEDLPSQSKENVTLTLFQKLKVQLSLDSSNVQHEKLELKLVEPHIPGFSVEKCTTDGATIKSEKRPIEEDKNDKSEKKPKWKKL